jgi:hypothetical protein
MGSREVPALERGHVGPGLEQRRGRRSPAIGTHEGSVNAASGDDPNFVVEHDGQIPPVVNHRNRRVEQGHIGCQHRQRGIVRWRQNGVGAGTVSNGAGHHGWNRDMAHLCTVDKNTAYERSEHHQLPRHLPQRPWFHGDNVFGRQIRHRCGLSGRHAWIQRVITWWFGNRIKGRFRIHDRTPLRWPLTDAFEANTLFNPLPVG